MKKLKKLLNRVLYTASFTLICGIIYLVLGMVFSITMLDISYMFFDQWHVAVRFCYVLFTVYILANAIKEDYKGWERGN